MWRDDGWMWRDTRDDRRGVRRWRNYHWRNHAAIDANRQIVVRVSRIVGAFNLYAGMALGAAF